MGVLFIFILMLCFGYLFCSVFCKYLSLLERIGLSYLFGMGLTTWLLFCLSWAGLKITRTSITVIVIVSICVLLLALKGKAGFAFSDLRGDLGQLKFYEKIMLGVIFITISSSLVITLYYPVNAWDALALYDFVGKIIAQTGYFAQIANQFRFFAAYPLLVPLGHTIVYLFGGSRPDFIYTFYLASFAMISYGFIRRETVRPVAFLATMTLVTYRMLFVHSTIAYTNLPYTAFYATGLIYLCHAITNDDKRYLLLSSLLIGLSTWARSLEPFWVTEIAIVFVYSLYRRRISPLIIFLVPLLLIRTPWSVFQAKLLGGVHSVNSQISMLSTPFLQGLNIGRIFEVSIYLFQHVVASWSPLFFLFIFSVLFMFFRKKIFKRDLFLLVIIVSNLAFLFLGTYLFSFIFDEWKIISGSAVRVSMCFPPLMIWYIALVIGADFFPGRTKTLRGNL